MAITITPTGSTLGAVLTDIDLTAMNEATWHQVEAAFHHYALLIFPAQNLSEEAQIAFASRFGEIEYLRADRTKKAVAISNQKPDGAVIDKNEHRFKILRGNEGWHTDSSYMPVSAKASVLSALVVPKAGGETEWADMRAAYDALDVDLRARVEGLSAYHSLYYSQYKIGHQAVEGAGYGFHDYGAPLRGLVKIHPVTGRKALYIGRHAYGIPGLASVDSDALLDELVTFACQAPRTYKHPWEPGDVIIWDNRCVLHRARPYDTSEARVMRHTRIAGDPASESAPTHKDVYALKAHPPGALTAAP